MGVLSLFVAPVEFASARVDRRGLLTLIAVTAICGSLTWAFWASTPGMAILADGQAASLERLERTLSPEDFERSKAFRIPLSTIVTRSAAGAAYEVATRTFVVSLVMLPVLTVLFLTPSVSWSLIFSMVAYCSPVFVIRTLLLLGLSFVHQTRIGTLSVPQSLGWVISPERTSVSFGDLFVERLDLFILWWAVLVGIAISSSYPAVSRKWLVAVCVSAYFVSVGIGAYFATFELAAVNGPVRGHR